MKNTDKAIVWTTNIDVKEWNEYIEENVMPQYKGGKNFSSVEEFVDTHYDICKAAIFELVKVYLEEEKCNLDIEKKGGIIDIIRGDAQFTSFYSAVTIGKNVNMCFPSDIKDESRYTFYVKYEGASLDFESDNIEMLNGDEVYFHHLYREIKQNVSEAEIYEFMMKIKNNTVTQKDIDYYTRPLGFDIQKIYEFGLKAPQKADSIEK